MRKNKISSLIIALALIFSLATPAFAAAIPSAKDFTDVPSNHKHYEAIDYCLQNGFMQGRGGGIFSPDGSMTRGEFITVWARTFQVQSHNFFDATKTSGEVDNSIVIMQGMGYINGVSEREFSKNSNITREEVAKIVTNSYLRGVDGVDNAEAYDDSDSISTWAINAVGACRIFDVFENIVINNTFKPHQNMTRSEICQVISNLQANSIRIDGNIEGGTVSADKALAKVNDVVVVSVTPDEGMQLVADSLQFNGNIISSDEGVYSFFMPAEDVVITAEFEVIPNTNSIVVSPQTLRTSVIVQKSAAAGETVIVSVSPEEGKRLVAGSLKFNGDVITATEGIYSFTMPDADVVITAQFETIPNLHRIAIFSPISGGSVSAPKDAEAGEVVTVEVTPGNNMQLVPGSLKYNGVTITKNGNVYDFVMPDYDIVITAQFEELG